MISDNESHHALCLGAEHSFRRILEHALQIAMSYV